MGRNNDGFLTKQEMLSSTSKLTDKQVTAVFSRNDKDGDGKFSKQEFKEMMMKEKKLDRKDSDVKKEKLNKRDSDVKQKQLVKRDSDVSDKQIKRKDSDFKIEIVKKDSNITKD